MSKGSLSQSPSSDDSWENDLLTKLTVISEVYRRVRDEGEKSFTPRDLITEALRETLLALNSLPGFRNEYYPLRPLSELMAALASLNRGRKSPLFTVPSKAKNQDNIADLIVKGTAVVWVELLTSVSITQTRARELVAKEYRRAGWKVNASTLADWCVRGSVVWEANAEGIERRVQTIKARQDWPWSEVQIIDQLRASVKNRNLQEYAASARL